MKVLLLIVILFAASDVVAQPFDFESRLGIVDVNEDNHLCLIVSNSKLRKGDPVSLIVLSKGQRVAQTTIEEKLEKSCSHNPDTGNSSFYRLRVVEKGKTNNLTQGPMVAIAVVDSPPIRLRRGVALTDLDKDRKSEFFRKCTSNEGIHFTVWTGKPLQGKRRWHYYYYLGYDVVPSCNERDYN